jgi:hypothetical protein
MLLFSGLHKWLTGRPYTRPTPARKPRSSFRPQLEFLEGREVPSTLKVTTLTDTGKGSLRYEIAAAQSGDIIGFDKKLNGGTINLWSDGELAINKNLAIQGPGAGLLAIDGGGSYGTRIFAVGPAATLSLSGLTLRSGDGRASIYSSDYYDGDGGAILNFGKLTVSGCTLSDNSAYHGGALANFGTLTVTGSTLSNNSVPSGYYGIGGGIYNTGWLSVSGCTLSGNSASYGGGIYNAGTATVSGCTLTGNSGYLDAFTNGGGGISNSGTLTVSNSYFSGNTPDNISGPYTDGGGNTFN